MPSFRRVFVSLLKQSHLNMNKLRFLGIILLVISVMATMQAQSYNYLWKQVEEQEKKQTLTNTTS